MKSKSKPLITLIVLAIIIIILILILGYRYMGMRLMANTPPPLVLIHSPTKSSRVQDGISENVHATARSEDGISRLELWVDGKYIYGEDAPEGGATSPMVLHKVWMPKGTGTHEITVRAYDSKGKEGIGTLYVIAEKTTEEMPSVGIDPLAEDILSEIVPVSDQPDESAPSSGGDGSSSSGSDGGSSSSAPSDSGSASSPPADEEPPASANSDIDLSIFEFLFGGVTLFDANDTNDGGERENILITFEGLSLQTDAAYDEVHCYVGIGLLTPRWIPDSDWDQSTDESFAMSGTRMWNIDEYLSGDHALHIGWPRNDPVNISINCVATTGGGTAAIDLGLAEIIAPPEQWDGITRSVNASLEGGFEFSYRIGQSELVPKDENPDIPSPYNLRINDVRNELEWDWDDPDPSAYPGNVAGFLVYLNDTLVFEVSGQETRAVRLPFSWFTPPCGVDYAFTVAAYTYPYSAGDWSPPSDPLTITNEPDALGGGCESQFWVEFLTLRTGITPVDEAENNWGVTISPVTGSFWSNEGATIFEGVDITQNYTYDLAELIMETTRYSNRVLITPTPGEDVIVDFDLGEYIGWDGFNDFCHGVQDTIPTDFLITNGFYEGTLLSEEGRGQRCQVDYVIYPLDGTPMGTSGDTMPLPLLEILAVRKQPDTGFIELDVRNRGSGSWANQNLLIQFVEPDTSLAGPSYNQPELFIGVGQTATIVTDQVVNSVWDYCFILDPQNEVLELDEFPEGSVPRITRYCLPRPDLRIEDVQYNYTEDLFQIYIVNDGEDETPLGSSTVNLADVIIAINPSEFAPEDAERFATGFGFFSGTLAPGEGAWVEWGPAVSRRVWLMDGYTVIVDAPRLIGETDETNNEYWVPAGNTIRLVWSGGMFRWYPRSSEQSCPIVDIPDPHDYSVDIEIYAESANSNRHIVSWHYDGEVTSSFEALLPFNGWDYEPYTTDFWIEGEESIRIDVNGQQSGSLPMGSTTTYYNPQDNWNLLLSAPIPYDGICLPEDRRSGGTAVLVYPSLFGWSDECGSWRVYVNTCILSRP